MNLKDEDGNYLYRLAFRQAIDLTGSGPILVQNSREGQGLFRSKWGTEIRAPWPKLEEGAEFTVTIECLEDKFVGYFNGEAMEGVEFAYRYPLANVAALELFGGWERVGGPSIEWLTFTLPVAQHAPDPADEEDETDEVSL